MEPVQSEEYKNYRIEIYFDEDPQSPRDWDNLGKFVLGHKRYDVPNEAGVNLEAYGGWTEVKDALKRHYGARVILPVWAYDHSGIALSTERSGQFADPWDSGQLGWIYATAEDIRTEYKVKAVQPKTVEKVKAVLRGEVETFSDYMGGQVFGYVVRDPAGEVVDSCWGIFLDESGFEYPLSQGRDAIDFEIAQLQTAAAEGRIP